MCRLRNIAMRDYQERTDGRTDRQTPDKVVPMCRYASQATQKAEVDQIIQSNWFCVHITAPDESSSVKIFCQYTKGGHFCATHITLSRQNIVFKLGSNKFLKILRLSNPANENIHQILNWFILVAKKTFPNTYFCPWAVWTERGCPPPWCCFPSPSRGRAGARPASDPRMTDIL